MYTWTGAGNGTLPSELYAGSKIVPPMPGENCPAEGDGNSYDSESYGGVRERGGQCWAQVSLSPRLPRSLSRSLSLTHTGAVLGTVLQPVWAHGPLVFHRQV